MEICDLWDTLNQIWERIWDLWEIWEIWEIYAQWAACKMYYLLTKQNYIYEKPFGFRAKHSVNHALITTTELIKDKLDHSKFFAGIFYGLEI